MILQLFFMPLACFQCLCYRSLLLYSLFSGTLGADKRQILGTYSDVLVAPTNTNEKKKEELSGILSYENIFCFMET